MTLKSVNKHLTDNFKRPSLFRGNFQLLCVQQCPRVPKSRMM